MIGQRVSRPLPRTGQFVPDHDWDRRSQTWSIGQYTLDAVPLFADRLPARRSADGETCNFKRWIRTVDILLANSRDWLFPKVSISSATFSQSIGRLDGEPAAFRKARA